MDQKRTQRIVGIVIVIALVIILFPLLFNKSDNATTVATTKEQTPAEQNASIPTQITNDANAPIQPVTNNQTESTSAIVSEKMADADQIIKDSPAVVNTLANKASNENIKVEESPQRLNNEALPAVVPIDNAPKEQHLEKAHVPVKMVTAKVIKIHTPVKKDLAKLAQAAWVVQMGSFRDKNNAHRLTDRLRAAGYKAFTREVAAKHGNQTRVYVGPEFKQIAAAKLSLEIEHDLNMHGIVVTYNPMAL
jgi:DedD protein